MYNFCNEWSSWQACWLSRCFLAIEPAFACTHPKVPGTARRHGNQPAMLRPSLGRKSNYGFYVCKWASAVRFWWLGPTSPPPPSGDLITWCSVRPLIKLYILSHCLTVCLCSVRPSCFFVGYEGQLDDHYVWRPVFFAFTANRPLLVFHDKSCQRIFQQQQQTNMTRIST